MEKLMNPAHMDYYHIQEQQQTPFSIDLQQLDLDVAELLEKAKIDDAVLMPHTMQQVSDEIKAILTRMKNETIEVDTLRTIQNIMKNYEALNTLYMKKIERADLELQSYIQGFTEEFSQL